MTVETIETGAAETLPGGRHRRLDDDASGSSSSSDPLPPDAAASQASSATEEDTAMIVEEEMGGEEEKADGDMATPSVGASLSTTNDDVIAASDESSAPDANAPVTVPPTTRQTTIDHNGTAGEEAGGLPLVPDGVDLGGPPTADVTASPWPSIVTLLSVVAGYYWFVLHRQRRRRTTGRGLLSSSSSLLLVDDAWKEHSRLELERIRRRHVNEGGVDGGRCVDDGDDQAVKLSGGSMKASDSDGVTRRKDKLEGSSLPQKDHHDDRGDGDLGEVKEESSLRRIHRSEDDDNEQERTARLRQQRRLDDRARMVQKIRLEEDDHGEGKVESKLPSSLGPRHSSSDDDDDDDDDDERERERAVRAEQQRRLDHARIGQQEQLQRAAAAARRERDRAKRQRDLALYGDLDHKTADAAVARRIEKAREEERRAEAERLEAASALEIDRLIRHEQDEEYRRSLEQDRRRDEERRRKEERRARRNAEIEAAWDRLGGRPTIEDDADTRDRCIGDGRGDGDSNGISSGGRVHIRLSLPSGRRIGRIFAANDAIGRVRDLALVHLTEEEDRKRLLELHDNDDDDVPPLTNFSLSTTFPRRVLDNPDMTLEEAGLYHNATLRVLPDDD